MRFRYWNVAITGQPGIQWCDSSREGCKQSFFCLLCFVCTLTIPKQDMVNAMAPGQRSFTEQQQLQRQQQAISGDAQEPSVQSAEQPPLGQMSELDRFGLAGLLRMIHSESPDVASLAVGQDLMTLGLDLNQPEYVPVLSGRLWSFLANHSIQTSPYILRFAVCCLNVLAASGTGFLSAFLLQRCQYPTTSISYP